MKSHTVHWAMRTRDVVRAKGLELRIGLGTFGGYQSTLDTS